MGIQRNGIHRYRQNIEEYNRNTSAILGSIEIEYDKLNELIDTDKADMVYLKAHGQISIDY